MLQFSPESFIIFNVAVLDQLILVAPALVYVVNNSKLSTQLVLYFGEEQRIRVSYFWTFFKACNYFKISSALCTIFASTRNEYENNSNMKYEIYIYLCVRTVNPFWRINFVE